MEGGQHGLIHPLMPVIPHEGKISRGCPANTIGSREHPANYLFDHGEVGFKCFKEGQEKRIVAAIATPRRLNRSEVRLKPTCQLKFLRLRDLVNQKEPPLFVRLRVLCRLPERVFGMARTSRIHEHDRNLPVLQSPKQEIGIAAANILLVSKQDKAPLEVVIEFHHLPIGIATVMPQECRGYLILEVQLERHVAK